MGRVVEHFWWEGGLKTCRGKGFEDLELVGGEGGEGLRIWGSEGVIEVWK